MQSLEYCHQLDLVSSEKEKLVVGPPPPPPPPPPLPASLVPHLSTVECTRSQWVKEDISGISIILGARSHDELSKWLFQNNLEISFHNLDTLTSDVVEKTAHLLNSFWPRSLESRLKSLSHEEETQNNPFSRNIICALQAKAHKFTQSNSSQGHLKPVFAVIGHGRVVEGTQASCGILESVIVSEHFRGCGLGKELVLKCECAAKESGRIKTIFLNTTDKQCFYSALGYRLCPAPLWSATGKKSLLPAEDEEKLSALFKGAKCAFGSREWMCKSL